MKSYRTLSIALFASALLLAGFAGNALAALTPACTVISNQATLAYKIGTVDQTAILSDPDGSGTDPTTFSVASLINLTNVTEATATAVTTNETDKVITFKITNTGNDDARYQLKLYDREGLTVGTHVDGFNMNTVRVYSDTDATYGSGGTEVEIAGSEAAQDGTPLGLAPNPSDGSVFVAPNGIIYVHVVADAPASATNGAKDLFTLEAIAYHDANNSIADGHASGQSWVESTNTSTNGCTAAVVRGDTIDSDDFATNGDLDSTTPNGAAVATAYYVITAAAITVEKDYAVISDPFGGTRPIPGAIVEYTIVVTNTSTSVDASTLSLVDPIPNNTDFIVGSESPTADITFSNSNTSTWTYDETVGGTISSGSINPAVLYLRATKASLPFNDLSDNEHIYTVKFRVKIEE